MTNRIRNISNSVMFIGGEDLFSQRYKSSVNLPVTVSAQDNTLFYFCNHPFPLAISAASNTEVFLRWI